MAKKKRYFFSLTEEMIMNEKADKFCAGRIEVYDTKSDFGYACYEARFMIPREFMDDFRKTWDGKESDEMPYIRWEYPQEEHSENKG